MPLPMVHIAVAREVALHLNWTASGAYCLGSISPDAVHMRTPYERQFKADSHLCEEKSGSFSKDVWCANALSAYKKCGTDDFGRGYIVHVLTDIFWNVTLEKQIRDRWTADPAPVQERGPAYYNDTDILDIMLYQNQPWRPDVFAYMAAAEAKPFFALVSDAETDAWRVRTLNWYDAHKIEDYLPLRYASYEEVEQFICDAARWVAERLA